MAEELALDLEELRQLQSIAKRPRIQSLIASEIRNLEKHELPTPECMKAVNNRLDQLESTSKGNMFNSPVLLQTSKEEAKAPVPTPISTSVKVPVNPSLSYVSLASFSWDQDNDKVKIYVSLEGVDQEKVQTEFKPMSFDAKFHDVQGKNYRCAIPKLNKEIVPEKCKVLVKPTRVIITLFKASKGNWPDLHFKEDKLKPNLDKEKDPMAGIMDLMKNMYDEGDDDMKRTIAKAWTDARSGKTADPLKGYP